MSCYVFATFNRTSITSRVEIKNLDLAANRALERFDGLNYWKLGGFGDHADSDNNEPFCSALLAIFV
jgi:hypothetical protein